MSLNRSVCWVVLGVAGVLQLMLLASGLNELLGDKGLKIGPAGSMEVQFHGNLYTAISWLVIAAVAVVILVSMIKIYYDVLITTTIGVFFIGALLGSDLPPAQDRLWAWGAAAAFTATLAVFVGQQFGWISRKSASRVSSLSRSA